LKNTTTPHIYLHGGGEMGELTRSYDWASTPLGPIEQWPLSLRNTVAMILSSKFPMFLWWGPDHIQFYNDAYRPSLGIDGKHPLALGQKGFDCWPEIWDTIYPLMLQVLNGGEGVWFEDLYLPIYRNGKMEDVYWTFSYSAVVGDTDQIEGVLVICTETTEKVNNLKTIQDSRNELEFAIDAAELGVWDLDPVTGTFTGNTRLKEWFGLKPEEHIPLSLATDVMAKKDRQKVIDAIAYATTYESGGNYDVEYTIINPKTKKEIIVKAKGRAWFNNDKIAYRFNGTLQDITESRKAEEKIAEANQLNDLILKSAGIGLFRIDLLTGRIDYNPAFAAIITGNADKKEISRKSFIKYVHPDDLAEREAALAEGMKTNEFYYSPRMIWEDGSVHRVHVMGTNTLDAEGKPIVFSGTVRDITILENQRLALEKAETQKHESDVKFRNVTDSSPTGLWLSDTEGQITYVNKAMTDWTGMSFDDFVNGQFPNSIFEDDREACANAFLAATSTQSHYEVIFRLNMANGKPLWCRAAGDPYYDKDSVFEGYAGYCMDIHEIVEGRKALSESEERFRSMIEEAPVATALYTGKDLIVEVANDMMLNIWGVDCSMIGKPLAQVVPELKGQSFLDTLAEVYITGKTYEVKAGAAKLKTGGILGIYYFDYTYKPLFNANGEVYGIMNMAINVTEQVLAQQRIEESRKQLLDSFEQSPVGIAILNTDKLTFTMANPFYGELVGRKPDDIIGKPLLEALPELEGQGFDDLLHGVIKTGIAYSANEVSATLSRKNGLEVIYVDLTYQPMYNSDDTVSGVLVVATDVTEQVRSRQNIETAQAALKGAIELAELATWSYNIKENTFHYSQRFMDWLGFTENTKYIDDAYNPLPADYVEMVDEGIKAAIAPGSSGKYENEHPIINRVTGQIRIIHAQAQVSYDAAGNAEFLSGSAQDVTKERKLQQELEFQVQQRTEELQEANEGLADAINALQQNNKELQQFAYIASHDLQEPTRKISIFSKMLMESLGTIDDRSRTYLTKINNSADRMGDLISDILAYSQLSKDSTLLKPVDLNKVINETITDFELIIEQSHAQIQYNDLPVIEAIPRQMSQLFGNLISNSLKYRRVDVAPVITITATKVTAKKAGIAAENDVDYYRFEFTDNGIGFSQEYADKIFNIFQRLHGKSEYSGTGIGLSICKKIVQNHHGTIEATADKGQGATFIVTLPSKQAFSDND
jgi:PAS domain S-box-containing protein